MSSATEDGGGCISDARVRNHFFKKTQKRGEGRKAVKEKDGNTCRIGTKGFGREKRRAESRGKSQTGWHSRARRGPRSRVTEKAFGSGDLTGTHEGKQNVEGTITQPRGGDPGGDSQKPQLRRAAPMRLAALGRKSARGRRDRPDMCGCSVPTAAGKTAPSSSARRRAPVGAQRACRPRTTARGHWADLRPAR